MFLFRDQIGRKVQLQSYPKKIVSLVPSQTELLFDLGLENEVSGITKFCVHPHHWFLSKKRVGGTKNIDVDIIDSLQPDLILANKEENTKNQVEILSAQYPVWISDVYNLSSAFEMIIGIGEITNTVTKANELVRRIDQAFQELVQFYELKNAEGSFRRHRSAYLIWKEPMMTVGRDTFIHSIMTLAGFENIFEKFERYPVVSIDDICSSDCELLFLSSEPYPFSQKEINHLQPLLPNTRIVLVDGEMFSWYGSRLLYAADYLKNLKSKL